MLEFLFVQLTLLWITLVVEVPILIALLDNRYSWRTKACIGIWLSTCTHPIAFWLFTHAGSMALEESIPVNLLTVLLAIEAGVILSEILLFYWITRTARKEERFGQGKDFLVIALANIVSCLAGIALGIQLG